jgi:flagellar biosynthesis protein FlhF
MKDLARLLQGVPGRRRALLCNAATNSADLADWVRDYRRLGLNSLFFTKLDECRHFGPLINNALGSGYPLSYITLGQNLADDLEITKPEVLASLLLIGGDPHD